MTCVAIAKELQRMSDSQEMNNGKHGCITQFILSSFCWEINKQKKKEKEKQACKQASYSVWY